MISKISNKQIKVLEGLAAKSPVIASWQHADLNFLLHCGLVRSEKAFAATGKLSDNTIWTLSQKGSAFLADERAVH